MSNPREAGQKADAHKVRDLYRVAFGSKAKNSARDLVILGLSRAGGKHVLDLWGGGLSANALVAAGFRVISVDSGGMDLRERNHLVSRSRKRRALEVTAAEDGYEARWGKVAKFAYQSDCAFLDFCGPWSSGVRQALVASRHMKAIAITLVADHDVTTDATTREERQAAYEVYIRLALNGKVSPSRSTFSVVRKLCTYRRDSGQIVWVFWATQKLVKIGAIPPPLVRYLDPGYHARKVEKSWAGRRERLEADPIYRQAYLSDKSIAEMERRRRPEVRARRRELHLEHMKDPEYRARKLAWRNAWYARKRDHAGTAASDNTLSSI